MDIKRILVKIRFERWRKKAVVEGVRSDLSILLTINMPSSSSEDRPPLFFAHVLADVRYSGAYLPTLDYKNSYKFQLSEGQAPGLVLSEKFQYRVIPVI